MVSPGLKFVLDSSDLDDKLETSCCSLVVVCTFCDVIYRGIVVIWFVKVMVDSPTVTAGLILSSVVVMIGYIC